MYKLLIYIIRKFLIYYYKIFNILLQNKYNLY